MRRNLPPVRPAFSMLRCPKATPGAPHRQIRNDCGPGATRHLSRMASVREGFALCVQWQGGDSRIGGPRSAAGGSAEMTGLIITFAQQKGGAGKTTVAAHVAVACALGGRSVALLDTD